MSELPADLPDALAALVGSVTACVVALDPEGRVDYVNDQFLSVSGYAREEVVGSDWFERFVATDEVRGVFQGVIGGGASRHENPIRTKDGALRHILWSNVPRRDPSGKVLGTLSMGADLTEQREAQRRLRMQQEALDHHAIVAITDRQGRITYANDRFCEISGYAREELLGQDHRLLNSGHHPSGFFKQLWATIGRGDVWRGEICNRSKTGGLYWVYTTIVPFRDAAGTIEQYVAIRADVTEQKEIQQQLIQAAKFAALGELAGNVAHEVNNPIGIISGKARLLLSGRHELPEKVRTELEKIVAQSDRVGRLTRGLLDYCRPAVSPKSPCDVHQPLLKALSFVESKANRQGVTVVRELMDSPPAVDASLAELEQVFLNLFLNAIDAMEGSGGELTVGTATQGEELSVWIADTGGGIPPELLERIFEPFFTTKAGKGTGLGLAICFGLIRGHGGRIEVDSSERGTRFTIWLPVWASEA